MAKTQLTIKNVKTIDGHIIDHFVPSSHDQLIDVEGQLTFLPALIGSQVHFDSTENWRNGAQAAVSGGITTVIDVPPEASPTHPKESFEEKNRQIEKLLVQEKIPLRYRLFFNATSSYLEEISKMRHSMGGLVLSMGSSDELLDIKTLERIFQVAAQEDLIIVLNPQRVLNDNLKTATERVNNAIELTEKYSAFVVLLSVSSLEEVSLIRQAKSRGLLFHASVTPHKLFLTKEEDRWGKGNTKDFFISSKKDKEALWEAIHDETMDMIASGEMAKILLPLLLNAFHEKKITLDKIVHLTRINVERIFRLLPTTDLVLVDLEKSQEVSEQHLIKGGQSPYVGKFLKGWPIYTVLKGKIFPISHQSRNQT